MSAPGPPPSPKCEHGRVDFENCAECRKRRAVKGNPMSDGSGAVRSVIIQIGNSDNKLTQTEWAHFSVGVRHAIESIVRHVHFQGGSDWDAPWQNACWVCELDVDQIDRLKAALMQQRKQWRQDSVAITIGKTEFI